MDSRTRKLLAIIKQERELTINELRVKGGFDSGKTRASVEELAAQGLVTYQDEQPPGGIGRPRKMVRVCE